MVDKTTIKYNNKEYEIEKTQDEQIVSPKGNLTRSAKNTIKVKDYNEGVWNHTCQCSKDGGNTWNKVDIKWGKGKQITIWGVIPIVVICIVAGTLWYLRKDSKNDEDG